MEQQTIIIAVVVMVSLCCVSSIAAYFLLKPAPPIAKVGEAVSCTSYTPKGDGAIYRFMGGKIIRWYPNPEIASSWDKEWASGARKKINCTGFTLGPDMNKNNM